MDTMLTFGARTMTKPGAQAPVLLRSPSKSGIKNPKCLDERLLAKRRVIFGVGISSEELSSGAHADSDCEGSVHLSSLSVNLLVYY